jgi:hypothetical protein
MFPFILIFCFFSFFPALPLGDYAFIGGGGEGVDIFNFLFRP